MGSGVCFCEFLSRWLKSNRYIQRIKESVRPTISYLIFTNHWQTMWTLWKTKEYPLTQLRQMQNAVYMFTTVLTINSKKELPICLDTWYYITLGILCNGKRTYILDLLRGGWDGGLLFPWCVYNKQKSGVALIRHFLLFGRNRTVLWVALPLRSHHRGQQHCLSQLAENVATVPPSSCD